MVGAVTSSPIIAIGYRSRLSEVKKGSDPTKPEIDEAYKRLLKDCNTRSDRADCRASAKRLKEASYAVYDQHRKWALAGCRGPLNVQ